ncbi:hypothetical protein NDK43_08090 [Neobacillus pocheonensis]|uniref:Uncharacterized protein n=1 Tax=Neobacillus pocheonensis TaxID=363869 RepID=A0ABT0WBF6_9BACI|nr:hypothetical protein [Neobacillus pocheonensis]
MGNHAGMGGNFGGSTGLTRLFNSEMGGQISWLIPAALILLVVAVWLVRRGWKSDRTVPALALWAGTFLITGVVFSFGQGTIHPYYTIALAPSIGAIIGIGVEVLWSRREQLAARIGLAAAIAVTAVWSYFLLDRTSTWNSWLRVAIFIPGGVAAIFIAVGPRLGQRLMIGAAAAGLAASLAGPFVYTMQTIATPHTGSMPSAGRQQAEMVSLVVLEAAKCQLGLIQTICPLGHSEALALEAVKCRLGPTQPIHPQGIPGTLAIPTVINMGTSNRVVLEVLMKHQAAQS